MLKKFPDNEEAMQRVGAELAKAMGHGPAVIYLRGALGAGKTVLARGFLRGFGFSDKVKSPTYTLVEPYQIGEQVIYHFDLYRLVDAEELLHIGIKDYFTDTSICLIEWPEKGKEYLPSADLLCDISFVAQDRCVKMEAHSTRGEEIMKRLRKCAE